MMARTVQALLVSLLVLCACAAVLPILVHADTPQDDLHAAIMAELLRDPRVADIPPAQLATLVDALAVQAQVQSVTAADILWHPQDFSNASVASQVVAEYFVQCDTAFAAFCPFNQAFGFAGTPSNLPAWLFVLSAVLYLLIPRVQRELHKAQPMREAVVS